MGSTVPVIGLASEPSAELWLGLVLAALVGLAPMVILLTGLREGIRRQQAPSRSLIDLLEERYARGELAAAEYQQRLIELLNDRYARGELRLNEYQARLDRIWLEEKAESATGWFPGAGQSAENVLRER